MGFSGFIQRYYGSRRGLARHLLAQVSWSLGAYRQFSRVPQSVKRLVFVCSGNICRSAYAERVAQVEGWPSASFGLHAPDGDRANERMQAIGRASGIDLDSHCTTSIGSYSYRRGDYLLAMEPAQCRELSRRFAGVPIGLLGVWADSPRAYLHDPYSASDEYMGLCATLIASAVRRIGRSGALSESRADG